MTVEAVGADAHLEGWPAKALELDLEGALAEQVALPDPAWNRASERTPKPKKKTTRKERRRR